MTALIAGVHTSTSEHRMRPVPRLRGISCCVTTPSSVNASWVRICFCWSDGNTSTMRLTASYVEFVCSVANTRCPVSAMVSAASMVSRSRISPMRMMSGSWRSTYLSAVGNDAVSAPTSRWLTMHFLWWWMYSTGSSMVMMCAWRVPLMRSSIAASVVDLPEPVGPVSNTRPFCRFVNSRTIGGRPSFSIGMISYGIWRIAIETTPRCRYTFAR